MKKVNTPVKGHRGTRKYTYTMTFALSESQVDLVRQGEIKLNCSGAEFIRRCLNRSGKKIIQEGWNIESPHER